MKTLEHKFIRLMLLFIFVTSRRNDWRVVTFEQIAQHMGRHGYQTFSWCQWSVAAGILHGTSSGFYIRPEHRDLNTSEFQTFINNKHI